jgi:hypothetical protein
LSLVSIAVLVLFPLAARAGGTVAFVETVDNEFNRYKVSASEGKDQEAAKKGAAESAILFAALQLTGSDEEKSRIEGMKDSFVKNEALAKVGRVLKTMFFDGGIKIDVLVDVNVKELRRKLETASLIKKATDLADEVGNPVILIAPEGSDGRKIQPAEKFIIDRIASFFTQRKYEIVDAGAMKNIGEMQKAVNAIEGVIDDPIAQVASIVGADIYVTYTAGQTAVVKASASIKAFETTTARLLASATGESRQYPAGTAVVDAVREAVSDAVPKTFEDLSGYWHEQAAKGKTYLVSIAGDMSDRERQKALRKALGEVGKTKFDTKTANRMAGTVKALGSADDVEEAIEDAIKNAGFNNVKMVLSNRQMFMFSVQ